MKTLGSGVTLPLNFTTDYCLDTYILKAKTELEFGNNKKARTILAEGWSEKSKESFSIFDTNSDPSFDLLIEASDSGEHILEACEDLILNDPYKEEWVLASKLIRLLGEKVDSVNKKGILETVLSHLDLMLRTTEQNEKIFKRYKWINDSQQREDVNKQVAKFILWLLNYPNFNSNEIIIELIAWLCTIEPELIISLLVEEVFSKKAIISSELAMHILLKVSENERKIVWNNLKAKRIEILAEDHFMKKYLLLKTLENIVPEIKEAEMLLAELQATFPKKLSEGADVEPDWDWLKMIEEPFYFLEQGGFITGKICREFEKKVEELSKEHEINKAELWKIHYYYERSFYNQKNFISPVEYMPRYTLNKVISNNVPLSKIEEVAEILDLTPDFFK